MTGGSGLGDAFEFLRLVWAVDHALQRNSKLLVRRLGVSGPQRLVIRAVGRLQPVTGTELASLLHLHASTLVVILTRLERDGFVTRTRDSGDRRRLLLRLTPKGRTIERSTRGTIEAAVGRALADSSAGEAAAARRVLERIAKTLQAEADSEIPAARRRRKR